MGKQQIIELIQLSVDNRLVNINESVFEGEQVHLLGANGAGKSTLLGALSGFFLSLTCQLRIHEKVLEHYSTQVLSQIRAYFTQQVTTQPILKVF